jgi:hypothetical protein
MPLIMLNHPSANQLPITGTTAALRSLPCGEKGKPSANLMEVHRRRPFSVQHQQGHTFSFRPGWESHAVKIIKARISGDEYPATIYCSGNTQHLAIFCNGA